jgi:two-component system sensor histidine kinase BaeS
VHESFFIKSSNTFLTYIVIGLGLTALLLSFLVARRISRPLQELTAAADKLAAGEPGGLVKVTTSDEIGRLAATFNRMSEALSAQDKMRKQLVSNAAHELRTPLMVIKGELEGMMDGLLPTSPEALQSLHDEATRLTAILNGVDELTRAQAAFININRQPVNLVPFFRQVLSKFSHQADELAIDIAVLGDDRCIVQLDPEHLTRIIINLASNALRAMPEGGTLEVKASQTDQNSALIIMSDSGTGISTDQLPHIFERFYKGKDGGLGLGLAIVRELVEANGGTISVASELGIGTSFLIEFPDTQN